MFVDIICQLLRKDGNEEKYSALDTESKKFLFLGNDRLKMILLVRRRSKQAASHDHASMSSHGSDINFKRKPSSMFGNHATGFVWLMATFEASDIMPREDRRLSMEERSR